jgi:hypothetical protein
MPCFAQGFYTLQIAVASNVHVSVSTLAQTNARCSANVEVCFRSNCRAAPKSLATLQN